MADMSCTREEDLLCVRISGFIHASEADELKERILDELSAMNGKPFRVMFDLRGIRALAPSVLKRVEELDDWLIDSTAVKIGTVFDSLLAKAQNLRVAQKSKGREELYTGRIEYFSKPDECLAWLKNAPGTGIGTQQRQAN